MMPRHRAYFDCVRVIPHTCYTTTFLIIFKWDTMWRLGWNWIRVIAMELASSLSTNLAFTSYMLLRSRRLFPGFVDLARVCANDRKSLIIGLRENNENDETNIRRRGTRMAPQSGATYFSSLHEKCLSLFLFSCFKVFERFCDCNVLN